MAKRRKTGRGWIVIGAVVLLVALAAVTPSPFVIQRPGPVVDAFGEIETEDGEVEVVRITGAETFETDGSLNVLSVTVSGTPDRPSSWLSLLGTVLDPTREVVPLESIYPAGSSSEDRRERNAALMEASQVSATAAALREVGEDVTATVRVLTVTEGGPADGVLVEGDAVLTADGQQVSGVSQLRAVLAEHGAETPVVLGIERDEQAMEVTVRPVADEAGDPALRIVASTELEFPYDVDLELDQIGGPSAGLIFALAIYDELTPGALTGGLNVSGTGTIDDAGAVGAIGGLQSKIWAASLAGRDLLLMPLDNCADLPSRLPEGLRIAPVANLGEAIGAIETAAAGGVPAGPERCEALLTAEG